MLTASIGIVAPMAPAGSGRSPSVMQQIAVQLRNVGFDCVLTSFVENRFLRVADMTMTLFRHRSELDLILVQVFSRRAFFAADVVSFLAKRFHIPIVFSIGGGAFPEFLEQSPVWARRVLSRVDEITTPSHFMADAIRSCGLAASVLPYPIMLDDYNFRVRDYPKPRLCWLRSHHAIYNPVDAVEAIVYLRDEFPDITLVMMGPDGGDGSLDRVHASIQKYNLSQNIQVKGSIPKEDVPTHLSNYDIYLNTTSYESFGIAVMEAAATGMCIVSTDVGELRNLWISEENAMLVPPKNPRKIANAIRRILTEPGLGKRLSENARTIAENYDWKALFPQWSTLLSRALQKSPAFHGNPLDQ